MYLTVFMDGLRYPEAPYVIAIESPDRAPVAAGLFLFALPDDLPTNQIDGACIFVEPGPSDASQRATGSKLFWVHNVQIVDHTLSLSLTFEYNGWAALDGGSLAVVSLNRPRVQVIGGLDVRANGSDITSCADIDIAALFTPTQPPAWNPLDNSIPFATYNRLYKRYYWSNNRWVNFLGTPINLDEEDQVDEDQYGRISGGSSLYNEFQFHWRKHLVPDVSGLRDYAAVFTYDRLVPAGCRIFKWRGTGSTDVLEGESAFRQMRAVAANLTTDQILWDESFHASSEANADAPPDWFPASNFTVSPRNELRISFVFWMGRRGGESRTTLGVEMRTIYFPSGRCG